VADEQILIADDEPDVRDLAQHVLELEGYKVEVAKDGLEALELARTGYFHVFLTDMKMPGMGGLEAFRAIRKIDPNVIGVGMTGFGTMKMAIEALKLGFAEFIVKPFTPGELVDTVARALSQERLRRENVRLNALMPLFDISQSFMADIDLDMLLHKILETAVEETSAAAGVLLVYDDSEDCFTLAARLGPTVSSEDFCHAVSDVTLDAVLAACPTAVVWQASDGQAPPVCERLFTSDMVPASILCHPLWVKDRFRGLLVLARGADQQGFLPGDRELVAVLAGQGAAAIENARLFLQIENAYRELSQVDHMKSEFINIVAHELRTPLALVLGYSSFLEGYLAEGEPREYLEVVTQNALRLRTIVDDMMNLRYLERREATLKVTTVALPEVIQTAVMAFSPLAEDKHQRLSTDIPDHLTEIEADQQKLELILGNLLSNAIKFTPEGGQIRVIASGGVPEVTIKVQDTGPGLSLPERERIFDRFYQVEDSLTRRHGGLGLGLSIVRGLVELHGGRIWVESTPGQGSTFCFTIPGHQPTQQEGMEDTQETLETA